MSALYTFPKQIAVNNGAVVPGAKLYFYQTGTSTPQNTYQDEDRTTPHANPVVADSMGVFEPIYLDPTLPNYRVTLKTSADVTVWQVDDVPSNQNTQQSMRLNSTLPSLFWNDTDGSSGFNKYRAIVDGNTWKLQLVNSLETVFTDLISANGASIDLGAATEIAGVLAATTDNGTFTATLTGCTTSPTASVKYRVCGKVVVLDIPAVSATSNATTMTLTGLPVALYSGINTEAMLCRVTDNGAASIGTASITASSGTITFGLGVGSGSFTGSGTKGVLSSVIVYRQ